MTWRLVADGDSVRIFDGARAATRGQFIDALASDALLRGALTATLRASTFDAYAFETPALSATTRDRDAEFAIVSVPALANVRPDSTPFAAQLAGVARIATFDNLGRDATLVVPSPAAVRDAAHLATFVRTADDALVDELWSAAGRAALARVARTPAPVWLSTAGLGVSWLHVRVDDRPKYYRTRRYQER